MAKRLCVVALVAAVALVAPVSAVPSPDAQDAGEKKHPGQENPATFFAKGLTDKGFGGKPFSEDGGHEDFIAKPFKMFPKFVKVGGFPAMKEINPNAKTSFMDGKKFQVPASAELRLSERQEELITPRELSSSTSSSSSFSTMQQVRDKPHHRLTRQTRQKSRPMARPVKPDAIAVNPDAVSIKPDAAPLQPGTETKTALPAVKKSGVVATTREEEEGFVLFFPKPADVIHRPEFPLNVPAPLESPSLKPGLGSQSSRPIPAPANSFSRPTSGGNARPSSGRPAPPAEAVPRPIVPPPPGGVIPRPGPPPPGAGGRPRRRPTQVPTLMDNILRPLRNMVNPPRQRFASGFPLQRQQ